MEGFEDLPVSGPSSSFLEVSFLSHPKASSSAMTRPDWAPLFLFRFFDFCSGFESGVR